MWTWQIKKYIGTESFISVFAYFGLQNQQTDPDAFRLLGEVKYEIKDYEGSVVAYRNAQMVSIMPETCWTWHVYGWKKKTY